LYFIHSIDQGIAMPMQQLCVHLRPLPAVDDGQEARLCSTAQIDFNDSSSDHPDAALPCGSGVLAGKVWKFGCKGIMVAAAVRKGGWGSGNTSDSNVSVLKLRDLEALAVSMLQDVDLKCR
jgi:hypothetical protein